MKSKVLGSLLTALGLAWAANASAVVVGMVDFGVIGQVAHLEATTLAETLINADAQNLQGYGVVTAVNGRLNYCAAAAGNPNCRLYYYFTAYTSQAFTPANVQFRGGIVDVYYDPGTGGPSTGATGSLLDYSSATNVAYITGLSHWVEFAGHA